ncbi:hydroxyacid dehydrogenase [Bradyrhizobium sp. STM 3562]|uniref:hydroxyacid dehydrogenase n=1 Tax=Bradyrhizobium sp. STM 3562 TaxID=578924 RepID=UPI00388F511E
MNIAMFETEEWERQACARLEPHHRVRCVAEPLDQRNAADFSDAEVASPFVNSRLDASALSHFPRLKLIATRSTGYDHIDLRYCAAHGIIVSNVPDYGDSTVAEHVFALLLAVARKIVDSVERTRRGRFTQTGLRGFELRDQMIGVVGTGRIGLRVIEIARGFGMNVVAYDLQPDEAAANRLKFAYTSLDRLLSDSDVVTLHVPATPGTVRLLSDREFSRMKPGAILINTARGHIVDVEALVRALADGKLRGAGLDVLPQEPLIREEAAIFHQEAVRDAEDFKALVANHVLLRFPNVIVTPHNAYNTEAALERIIATTLANIEAFAQGTPQNVVSSH